jgi:hypothetical protein
MATQTFAVQMVNFGINKGEFQTLEAAINEARRIGFECAIWSVLDGKWAELVKTVKP